MRSSYPLEPTVITCNPPTSSAKKAYQQHSTGASSAKPPAGGGFVSSYDDISQELKINVIESRYDSVKSKPLSAASSPRPSPDPVTSAAAPPGGRRVVVNGGAQLLTDNSSGAKPKTIKPKVILSRDQQPQQQRPAAQAGVRSGDAALNKRVPHLSQSAGNSAISSLDQDEWSRQLDQLDHLGTLAAHSQGDAFSAFSQPDAAATGAGADAAGGAHSSQGKALLNNNNHLQSLYGHVQKPPPASTGAAASRKSATLGRHKNHVVSERLIRSDPEDFYHAHAPRSDHATARDADDSRLQTGAELHIREVEDQLEKIFTPAPAEILKVTLDKTGEPDYGLSLSDGVYEKGVYISAVRPNGPAEKAALLPFDRILQVSRGCYTVTVLCNKY